MAATETFLTADEYLRLPDEGRPTELVRGKLVTMNLPGFRHGEISGRIMELLLDYLRHKPLGRLVTNDSGIVTQRDPDTVRGADVAFYSFARLPKAARPRGYPAVAPDLVFEVRSPDDRWPALLAKAGEYLAAGVTLVAVVDPDTETVTTYYADRPSRTWNAGEELALPEVLKDFRVSVARFFD